MFAGQCAHKDKERFRSVISRTRVSLLGKETEEKQYRGRKINTLPVLLECTVGQRRTRRYWRRFYRRQAGTPLLNGQRSAWSS